MKNTFSGCRLVRLDPRAPSSKVSLLLNLNSSMGTSLIILKPVRRSVTAVCTPIPGLALSQPSIHDDEQDLSSPPYKNGPEAADETRREL